MQHCLVGLQLSKETLQCACLIAAAGYLQLRASTFIVLAIVTHTRCTRQPTHCHCHCSQYCLNAATVCLSVQGVTRTPWSVCLSRQQRRDDVLSVLAVAACHHSTRRLPGSTSACHFTFNHSPCHHVTAPALQTAIVTKHCTVCIDCQSAAE